MSNQIYHIPALLKESVDGLNIDPDGVYVDVTFGGGGHSREILSRLSERGLLVVFDQDADTIANIPDDARLIFVQSNFRYLKNFLRYHEIEKVDGVLADLGVSSHHFDDNNRGFSFRFAADLDMRMNQSAKKTALDVLNTYPEDKLADIFFFFGELRQAKKIAAEIVKKRNEKMLASSEEFLSLLEKFTHQEKEKKILAQAFQALRIEVNDELNALSDMLIQSLDVLKYGGRMSVISYHSLEDRMVKNFFRTGNFEGEVHQDFFGNVESPFRIINRKVIVPTEDEQKRNPRSRSAKLRIAEKNLENEKA